MKIEDQCWFKTCWYRITNFPLQLCQRSSLRNRIPLRSSPFLFSQAAHNEASEVPKNTHSRRASFTAEFPYRGRPFLLHYKRPRFRNKNPQIARKERVSIRTIPSIPRLRCSNTLIRANILINRTRGRYTWPGSIDRYRKILYFRVICPRYARRKRERERGRVKKMMIFVKCHGNGRTSRWWCVSY